MINYIIINNNFESHNSLKLSFTNTQGLCSNFVDCESGNFSVRGYLPLIRKDSSTHMYGFAVSLKEGLPFARDFSLENSADSYLCF